MTEQVVDAVEEVDGVDTFKTKLLRRFTTFNGSWTDSPSHFRDALRGACVSLRKIQPFLKEEH